MTPTRILLVDDHSLVRAGIRSLLEKVPDFDVVGEASNGVDALKLIKSQQVEVVITDIAMEGMNGIETARSITKEFPWIKVIILSMYNYEEYVVHALEAGVGGYLLKDAATSELELALRSVMRGESYLSPRVSQTLVNDYLRRLRQQDQPPATDREVEIIELSPRQIEILKLIAGSKTNKEISRILDISLKTVDNHRTQLMRRLNIHDIAALVRYAITKGLISSDQ